jgi:hypothetical protein
MHLGGYENHALLKIFLARQQASMQSCSHSAQEKLFRGGHPARSESTGQYMYVCIQLYDRCTRQQGAAELTRWMWEMHRRDVRR